MERRLELHAKLSALIGTDDVYFQPPESKKISYPCIIYHLNDAMTTHANDDYYKVNKRYTVTYITRNPDNDFVKQMLREFKYCSFDRWYAMDNLNHFVFDLYY